MNSFASFSRRSFLKGAAAAALPAWFVEAERARAQQQPSTSPNEKPNVALIGCGGRGSGDIRDAGKFGNVVALCDVDESHFGNLLKTFPNAKTYGDFRKLLERND